MSRASERSDLKSKERHLLRHKGSWQEEASATLPSGTSGLDSDSAPADLWADFGSLAGKTRDEYYSASSGKGQPQG